MCLLALCSSSLGKCPFLSLADLLTETFVVYLLSFLRFLSLFDINPLSGAEFANICSHSVHLFFILLIFFFIVQQLLSLTYSYLSIFFIIAYASGVLYKKSSHTAMFNISVFPLSSSGIRWFHDLYLNPQSTMS